MPLAISINKAKFNEHLASYRSARVSPASWRSPRPKRIMSQAGQRAVSFHALVVLLLALVTTAGAPTQSIGNTGPDLVNGPDLVKGPDRHRANDLVCFGSKY